MSDAPIDWSGFNPDEPIPVVLAEGVDPGNVEETWSEDDSNLYQHAKRELEAAGVLSTESDYDGMLGNAVLDLIKVFAQQGHSGFSAAMTTELFSKLSRYEPLGPLTDDPEEWFQVHEGYVGEPEPLWQSRRKPSAFSNDGGKTYYDLDEPLQGNGTPTMFNSQKKEG